MRLMFDRHGTSHMDLDVVPDVFHEVAVKKVQRKFGKDLGRHAIGEDWGLGRIPT